MLTLVIFAGVVSVTALMSQHIARDEAVRDARARTAGIANGIAAPLVDSRVREKDPQAMRDLDTALRNRMRDGTVSHMTVWDLDGTVIWADDPDEVHLDEGLPVEVTAPVGGGSETLGSEVLSVAHVAVGSEELVEVYVRTLDAEGRPFVFEAYTPRDRLQTDSSELAAELLPLTVGPLLVMALAIVPLALLMARRIDRANASRRQILHHSLASWNRERERLAQSLHDDVIQDLSAMGYALPAVLDALPRDARGARARATGERMNQALISSVRTLRLALTDLAPSGFEGSSLAMALHALVEQHRRRGLAVALSLDPELRTEGFAGTLVYRVVREGLQNVTKHADATEVSARVSRGAGVVEVTIDDDGRGPGEAAASEGHVGLRLLGQLLEEAGGNLELVGRPGGGARLAAVIPADLPGADGTLRD